MKYNPIKTRSDPLRPMNALNRMIDHKTLSGEHMIRPFPNLKGSPSNPDRAWGNPFSTHCHVLPVYSPLAVLSGGDTRSRWFHDRKRMNGNLALPHAGLTG